jgi:hypothetical protein
VTAFFLSCNRERFIKESFKAYGVKFKAKDIVGYRNFNDQGMCYYSDVINNLSYDTVTFKNRLGAFRLNAGNFKEGSLDFLNLSNSENPDGYTYLDKIDYAYYTDWGFKFLEDKYPKKIKDPAYVQFKKLFLSQTSDRKKREILLLDTNREYRVLLLETRYTENANSITLKSRKINKMTQKATVEAKGNIDNLIEKFTQNIEDKKIKDSVSTKLSNYFYRLAEKTFEVRGKYITIRFRDEYISKVHYFANTVPCNTSQKDEFLNNLIIYKDTINPYQEKGKKATVQKGLAINSAIFAFQLEGGNTKNIKDSITVDLEAAGFVKESNISELAISASLAFNRSSSLNFTNEFSKVWIIKFATDNILDKFDTKMKFEEKTKQLSELKEAEIQK